MMLGRDNSWMHTFILANVLECKGEASVFSFNNADLYIRLVTTS